MRRNNPNIGSARGGSGGGPSAGTKIMCFVYLITMMILFFIYRMGSFGMGEEERTSAHRHRKGGTTLPPKVNNHNHLFVQGEGANDKEVANPDAAAASELRSQIKKNNAKMSQQAQLISQQKQELETIRAVKRKQAAKERAKAGNAWSTPEDALEALRKPEQQQVVKEVKDSINKRHEGHHGNKKMTSRLHKAQSREPKTHPLYKADDRASFFGHIEARPDDSNYFRCIPSNTSALHRWACLINEKQRGHEALIMSDFAAHAYDREVSLLMEDLVREEYQHQVQAAKRHHDLQEAKDEEVVAKKREPTEFSIGQPIQSNGHPNLILGSILQRYFNVDDKDKNNIQPGSRTATVLETLMGQARRYGGQYWRSIAEGFGSSGRVVMDDESLSTSTNGVGYSFVSAWVPQSTRNCDPRRQPPGIFLDNTTSILELESALFHLTSKAFNHARMDLDILRTEGPEAWKQAKAKFLQPLAESNSWHLHCAWSATRLLSLARDVVSSYGKLGKLEQSNQQPPKRNDGKEDEDGHNPGLQLWRSRRFILEKDRLPTVSASGDPMPDTNLVPDSIKDPKDVERYKKRSSAKKMLCVLMVPVAPENDFKEYSQIVDRYQSTPKGALMEGGCVHLELIFGLSAPAKEKEVPDVRGQPEHDQQFMHASCTNHVDNLLKLKFPDGSRNVNTDLLSTLPGYEQGSFAAQVGNFVRYRCNHFDAVAHKTGVSQGQSGTAVAASALAISSGWEGAIRVMSDDHSLKPHEQFSRWWPDSHKVLRGAEWIGPKNRERVVNGFEALNLLPFDYVAVIPHNADFQASAFTSNYATSPRVIAAGTTIGAARFFGSLGFAARVFEPESWAELRKALHGEQAEHGPIGVKELEDLVANTNRLMLFNRHAQLLLTKVLKSSLCRERILGVVDEKGQQVKQTLTPRVLIDYFPLCLRRYSMKMTVPRLEDMSLEPISSYRFTASDSPVENYALIQDKKDSGNEGDGANTSGGNILTEAVFSVSM